MMNKYFDIDGETIKLSSSWTLANLIAIKKQCVQTSIKSSQRLVIDGTALELIDSAGAWWINTWLEKIAAKKTFELINFTDAHKKLLSIVSEKSVSSVPKKSKPSALKIIGKFTLQQIDSLNVFLSMVGELSIELLSVVVRPRKLRVKQIFKIVETAGFQALGIIALLSMMIGIVMTYQMGLQLRTYGANIFIVDLLGLAILREFAPLITAIMVAGRTGSAFTAQLGTMKLNQEIDALNTMGIKPTSLLLLPRIIGLVIALPLLTMWADIFGVLGGIIMSHNLLKVSWYDFLSRFQHVISLKSLIIGLGKAPVFALIISSIGCYTGMQVAGSADSVGKQTTKSVVLSIFFILIVDALFSVVLSKLKL